MKMEDLPTTSKKVSQVLSKKMKEDKEKSKEGLDLTSLAKKLAKRKLKNMKKNK